MTINLGSLGAGSAPKWERSALIWGRAMAPRRSPSRGARYHGRTAACSLAAVPGRQCARCPIIRVPARSRPATPGRPYPADTRARSHAHPLDRALPRTRIRPTGHTLVSGFRIVHGYVGVDFCHLLTGCIGVIQYGLQITGEPPCWMKSTSLDFFQN